MPIIDEFYNMKRLTTLWLLAAVTLQPALAQQRPSWGDQGNGTYVNPVLNADYSDPDVVRVGEKFYMVASDFHYMGMQVLESTDMVNWHIVSQIFDRLSYPGWDENKHFAGGSWAPSIRCHEGRLYVYFCTPEEGLFMSWADDPRGPWSPLHCLREVPKWEDPCPLWDDDGKAYLGRSQHGAGPIIIHRMTPDGRQLLDDGVTVYTGPVAEGTKLMKRDGYYYLIIPEGGVGQGWQTVLRARNIYGPYEKRVVLEQGSTDVNGPHQGALVDTPDGRWWFYHFQESSPRGRVVHLQPARWVDGWPLMGVDIDGNGIGEPVPVWTCPLPSKPALPQTSDDFSGATTVWVGQQQRQLGPQWQWNHNPADEAWSLAARRGWLTLRALKAATLKESRNMLTQKTMGYESKATTKIDCQGMKDGTHAGLLCTGREFMGIGICQVEGRRWLYTENDGKRQMVRPWTGMTAYLRVDIDSKKNRHCLMVSSDGKRFTTVGEPFSLRMGSWKGSRVGLYCYHTADDGGTAALDYFDYTVSN